MSREHDARIPSDIENNRQKREREDAKEPLTPISETKRANATTPTTVILLKQGMFSPHSPIAPQASPQRGFSSGDSPISPSRNLMTLQEAKLRYETIAHEVQDFLNTGIKDQINLKTFIAEKMRLLTNLQVSMPKNPKIGAACQTLINRLATHLMEAHDVDNAHKIQEYKTPLKISGRK